MFDVTNGVIRDYIASCGFSPETGRLCIAGIGGVTPKGASAVSLNDNAPNLYNDTILVFGTEFKLYRGTVDPGVTKATNPRGLAHLTGIDDGHGRPWKFEKGFHHPERDGHTNPCLVQAEKVTVLRDHGFVDVGMFGIHMHAGGVNEKVGDWSEGCVVWHGGRGQGTPWDDFRAIYEASGQTSFTLYLMDGHKLTKHLGLI